MNGLTRSEWFVGAVFLMLLFTLFGCTDNSTETRYVDYSGIQVPTDVPDKTCRSCHVRVHTK